MKSLYLWNAEEYNWHSFSYENLSDLKEEFFKRGISIGNEAIIGYEARIGDGASIGYGASIGDGARIGNGASIGYRASIGDEASIGYEASIGDGARIGNGASIGYRASIGDEARIGYEASIGNEARIGNRASIGNEARILKTIFITGSKHPVNWWGEGQIQIGCMVKSIEEWERDYIEVGKSENYSDEQIAEYKSYIEICRKLQDKKAE